MINREGNQYHWFAPAEIDRLILKLRVDDNLSPIMKSVLDELQVADLRADTSTIPVGRLGNALGLVSGSKPLWLSSEEYKYVKKLLAE